MSKTQKAKIEDLQFDDKNFNKGTVKGAGLMTKSFQKFGAGRSVLVDKNNKLIAGNKSAEEFGALGGKEVLIIDTTGETLVAVRRTDIDLDTPEGREMALADNAAAAANIAFVEELIVEELGAQAIDEWKVPTVHISDDNFDTQFSLNNGDRQPFQQMTFTMADEQAEELKLALTQIKQAEDFRNMETFGNQNQNGNALYYMLRQWAEQRK